MSSQAPSRVRGEVNRSKIGLKVDSLDDPPPRSLRTPSPSPSGPPKRTRQTDSQQRPRPQSQIYPATAKSSFMDDVPHNQRGSGSEVIQPKRRELPQQPPQHPQSQSQSRPRPQSQNFQQQQNPMTFDAATGVACAPPAGNAGICASPSEDSCPGLHRRGSCITTPMTTHDQSPSSPAPLKMANILKMEEDDRKSFQQRFSPQNVPSINLHHTGQQQFQGQPPSINVQHTGNHQNQQPYQNQPNAPLINVGSPPESTASSPRIAVHHTGRTDMTNGTHQMIPIINFDTMPSSPPANPGMPSINTSEEAPSPTNGNGRPPPQIFEVPGISVSGQFDDGSSNGAPQISVSASGDNGHNHNHNHGPQSHQHPHPHQPQQARFGPIVGRIVSAMGVRWHPNCFKCSVCSELLEHVSSYEHDGRPYCHLDYHENFAPRCYSCKTPIIEEQFISLDDPALGKRTYHMEHFFCAECGDPFLTPSMSNTSGELALSGDGDFEGFTVYKGHPYCEPCHVRLRLPKCKKCKKSIRDHDRAVEALGGKWCWSCFVCEGCDRPFDDPSFFQRDGHPYCEHCFSIILRNEM
ncbi:hypothetical protein FA13DRAFT_1729645 [Coprinellus micaceus]|uniref:LIM zinc-binding domain-containing protein n=1 Tax=Coprinellus micaceus TaxID=71717 RepID=A0A4Y7TIY9_COPMI|nr:hypothetical protein FA13DRAFT_1729645 [Coprinellus micaceus]